MKIAKIIRYIFLRYEFTWLCLVSAILSAAKNMRFRMQKSNAVGTHLFTRQRTKFDWTLPYCIRKISVFCFNFFYFYLFLILVSTPKTRRITKERVMHTQLALHVASSDWNTFLDTESRQNSRYYRISLWCPPPNARTGNSITSTFSLGHAHSHIARRRRYACVSARWQRLYWPMVWMYIGIVCMYRIGWFR